MQNQIELILRTGGSVTTEYTWTFAGVGDGAIICLPPKIELNTGSLSPTPIDANAVWQQLADEGGTITVIDGDGDVAGTLTINGWNGVDLLYFDSVVGCDLISVKAAYFTFSLTTNSTVEHFLDLYPNESISLSYQFTDLNNFTQIGTFSRDFRIPATKRNVEALGPLYDYNFVDDVQSFSRKYNCELRVDTIPISRGYLRVMAAYKQQDYLSDFQVSFYSQAPNFVKEIGEKKLKDITDLMNQNENVVLSNVTVQNNFRIWALIDRAVGNKAFSELGETNTRSVYDVGGSPLYAGDLTPCVRADYLLTEIFKDAGFELDATNLLNIIQDYYVPWVNTEKIIFAQAVSDYGFRAKNTTAVNSTGYATNLVFPYNFEVFDNAFSYNQVTYTFTPNAIGYYKFRVTTAVSNVNRIGLIRFKIRVTDPSSAITDYYVQQSGQYVNSVLIMTGVNADYIYLAAGYTCQVIYSHDIVDGSGTPTITYDANANFFELEDLQILTNADIVYPFNAPDVKQIDFVSDLIKMHNLAVVPDIAVENKLKLEPMQTYIGSGDTLDWTKKLDTSKDIVIKGTDDLRKSKLSFTYSAGQDTYSKLFVDQGRVYGDYKAEPYLVTNTQVPSSFQSGETSVKLVAQSTPATQINGSNYIVPRFWTQSGDEPPKFVAPGLRFLYYAENVGVYMYDEASATSAVQSIPTVNHYSDTYDFNPDYNDKDLNWAPETPLHDYTANPFDNLFTLYWRDYLDTIYSDDARILEANFALNNTDILTLNFADFIFVKDAYWRILELSDYKMGQFESTRVKLLKMNPGQAAPPKCNMKPGSVNPDGSVNFLSLSGAPVSATQVCCDAYNYTWSESTNTCYARPSDRPSVNKPITDASNKGEITGFNTISKGLYNINTTSNLDAGTSSFSVFAGNDIKIEGTNDNLIAIGDTINLKGDQRGAALFGKSVESVVPGLVIGGGWPGDNRGYGYEGSQSAGTFLMSNQGTYPATLNVVELFIEGIANKRIEMEDNMLWYMRVHLMVQPTINQYINATITAQMGKSGGIAFATAPIVQYQDTSMAGRTVNLIIDTATNTAQHRMNIQLAGGTYPFITRLVAQINYTQFR
jgi:hypothetical protein